MVETRLMTPADLFAMSEDDQSDYELVDGVLVRGPDVGFWHGRSSVRFSTRIATFVEEHDLGEVVDADTQFILGPRTVRRPDVAFVATHRLPPEDDDDQRYRGAPDLAVEVLSPANVPTDIERKVAEYLSTGGRLVWVVNRQDQTVTVHARQREPVTLGPDDMLDGEDVLPGFQVRIGESFGGDGSAIKRSPNVGADQEREMVETRLLTPADLFAMPDEDQKGYELVDGVLVEEPEVVLEHGGVGGDLHGFIWSFVREHGLGKVFTSDTQFILGPNTVRRPDVSFISNARLPDRVDFERWYRAAPDLAVEVLSPSNTPQDVERKAMEYFAAGGGLVWVVDWRGRTVVVHAPGRQPVTLGPDDELDGEDVLPGFRLRIGEVLAPFPE